MLSVDLDAATEPERLELLSALYMHLTSADVSTVILASYTAGEVDDVIRRLQGDGPAWIASEHE